MFIHPKRDYIADEQNAEGMLQGSLACVFCLTLSYDCRTLYGFWRLIRKISRGVEVLAGAVTGQCRQQEMMPGSYDNQGLT